MVHRPGGDVQSAAGIDHFLLTIQDSPDRLEPHKHEINLSAQTEHMLLRLLEQLKNRQWLQRCAAPLASYGKGR